MSLLNSGSFAKLCGISRHTLLFYDKENILKPKIIKENGYRAYGMEQFYTFMIISSLKIAGCSLNEIKEYMHESDETKILNFLKDKQKNLSLEIIKLKEKNLIVSDIIKGFEKSLSIGNDLLTYELLPEEKLEIEIRFKDGNLSEIDKISYISQNKPKFEGESNLAKPPFGNVLDTSYAREGKMFGIIHFSSASDKTKNDHIYIKKSGEYGCVKHTGNKKSHGEFIKEILKKIENDGYHIENELYAYDLPSFIHKNGEETYNIQYFIPVLKI